MANTKRSREKEEFWRWVFREREQSGLTVRDFCRREGLSEPSFYAWRKKIAQRDSPSAECEEKFIPVEVIDSRSGAKRRDQDIPSIERLEIVTPGGFTLRFGSEADLSCLCEVLTAIARTEEGVASC